MFTWTNHSEEIRFAFEENGTRIPVLRWAQAAPSQQLPAAAAILGLIEAGNAQDIGDVAIVPHIHVAEFDARVASILRLPDAAPFILDIRHNSTIDRPEFQCRWVRQNGQPILGPRRTGCILQVGNREYRLSAEHFRLADGTDRFNETPADDLQARLVKYGNFRASLPAEAQQAIQSTGYLVSTRVAHARAFSLSVSATADGFIFEPVLFSGSENKTEPDANPSPLLPPEYQKTFAIQRFAQQSDCQPRYALSNGWYVVLEPQLQRALSVVRRIQRADKETRRTFVRNPRAALREALGDDCDEDVIESLFVETPDFISQRVLDVGVRQPVAIPWVVQARDPWLPPESFGLLIDGERLTLKREDLPVIQEKLDAAMSAGQSTFEHAGKQIPANADARNALDVLAKQGETVQEDGAKTATLPSLPKGNERDVLLIVDNFLEVGFASKSTPREPVLEMGIPCGLRTTPKRHQVCGIEWLQQAWRSGRTGVLLADDMGLGKTFQALAFLLWLKQNWREKEVPHRPILIVAPTGLLKNWEQEHKQHLESAGLGMALRAHGAGLRSLTIHGNMQPELDRSKLESADWILTTYETLRDHQLSFGSVHFSVIVLDEVQKTKTPGTLMTDAVKAMHADFVLAMTGTPIENRLADLWCIMDTVQPGWLGTLKEFSRTYEQNPDHDDLRSLRRRLDTPADPAPAIMLRRMKADHLEGLPEKKEHIERVVMPSVQAEEYLQAIQDARTVQGRGRMLEVLHRIRNVSLHPLMPDAADPESYIAQSARLIACFKILDNIQKSAQKALIFLESMEMQSALMVMIQNRYGLSEPPLLINGKVDGGRRQARVNAFQTEPGGFGVMVLSPRAGGVGLTLTAANHVIHLSRWWNPAVEDQCTDRVFRIGQQRAVHVYFPLAVHPDPSLSEHSFDLRLHRLLERKRELSRDLLIAPEDAENDAKQLFEETIIDS